MRPLSSRAFAAWSLVVVTAVAAAFWIPGYALTHTFPIPLDDVYIHFDFARSAALGHPGSWLVGNGYSSGATSALYPLLLAPGWLLGFRGQRLAWFAAALAIVFVVDLARSVRALLAPRSLALDVAIPLSLCAVPLLDWSLFSGMETALVAAVLGRALLAVRRAEDAAADARPAAQRYAGLWLALLSATRPELLALALPLGVSVAHAGRSISAPRSLLRALAPTVAFVSAQALLNRALTGEFAAAGAVRKLLTSRPYSTGLEVVIDVLKNLIVLRVQAFDVALGGGVFALALPTLALTALVDRRSRRLAIPLVLGSLGMLLLVSLNATARFQNFRYAAPSLLLLVVAALLGAGALARRGRLGMLVGGLSLVVAAIAPARLFSRQIDLFARASRNIEQQQVEVARRLDAMGASRVLLNDAGAIPYLSRVSAIDGLGLGGYRGLPFARASVHGVPAVVELLERLPPRERPDTLALYPGWWPGLADVFGRRVDSVRIDDNVMCGADEKVIYAADWSALALPGDAREGVLDALDVADLIDERAHHTELPVPEGAWVIGDVLPLDGHPRFDAGRIVPEGRSLSFALAASIEGNATLALRTDDVGAFALRVTIEREGGVMATHDARFEPETRGGAWREVAIPIGSTQRGDRVRLTATVSALRVFHVWLLAGANANSR